VADVAETVVDPERRLVLTPPGPGSWRVDKAHVVRPATRSHHELVPGPFIEALARLFADYGIPVDRYEQVPVAGFLYTQMLPLAPEGFAERMAAADEAVATARWRTELERWDREVKPASIRRHLELVRVDLDGLDDAALADHVRTCADHLQAMIAQHHEFDGGAMLPVGDFLATVAEWTGTPHHELLNLFAGASPVSAGECPELDEVRIALRVDAAAAALVRDPSNDPAAVIAELRHTCPPVAAWLELVGDRILDGFDVDQPRAVEQPDLLVAGLRRALDDRAVADVSDQVAAVRAMVPAEHRADFDQRYADALGGYRLRDERGVYSDSGAFGLLRRAMLAVGERLVRGAVLPDGEAHLVTEAGIDEVVALLGGPSPVDVPSADELRRRHDDRHRWTVADVPSVLGDPPADPPPLELLPPAMARMTRAILTSSGHMGSTPPEDDTASRSLAGVPGSAGEVVGTARIVRTVDDLFAVESGDVIVAITTAESFNLALALASAVVTDQGGLLSHAAILAREYGIPAVVGTEHATARIPHGATVRVDGTTGTVTW
jgi:pyruvate,water dikinase